MIASMKALDRVSVVEAVERLRLQAVEGILVIAPLKDAADALLHGPEGIPQMAVEGGPTAAIPVVEVDQFAGAVRATRHLLELGHQTVWHIAGPPEFLESEQRLEGWRATLEASGSEQPPPRIGDWGARSGYELGR
jgi:DNA-binding LacI/PurR family transcriptional regulator